VEPTAICQGELIQVVREHGPIKLDLEVIGFREVQQALSPRRVFLSEIDLALGAELGVSQTQAALWCAAHTAMTLARVETLQFFEWGDGVEPGIAVNSGTPSLPGPARNKSLVSQQSCCQSAKVIGVNRTRSLWTATRPTTCSCRKRRFSA
jgi:hypothetical protein